MKAHFVTFLSPGTFMHEQTTRPIDSWDAATAVEMARTIIERHGARPFGFYFSTRERGPEDLDSKVTKRSGTHFLGGRILDLAAVQREMPQESILIANMKGNNIAKVIVNRNSWRATLPFLPDDVLLEVTL